MSEESKFILTIKVTKEISDELGRPIIGSGGWQSLLRSLRDRSIGGHISLDLHWIERISRYWGGYGSGGYQGRLDPLVREIESASRVISRIVDPVEVSFRMGKVD